ncbi:hypothetical protein GCM10017691_24150 [Pseudonocardia petroleophila]|uniref:Uncharacterized protein n=1 Tax=Pseudonocardia petroleophila TaxID=37331 RepID=A0A7G7MFT0_9PSEU|nr:hypothetical protein [Pseudonocardia petroleophila]QNG51641.1 hypothetical protein H6H00_26635 [Pseudonocardia petroleophila]
MRDGLLDGAQLGREDARVPMEQRVQLMIIDDSTDDRVLFEGYVPVMPRIGEQIDPGLLTDKKTGLPVGYDGTWTVEGVWWHGLVIPRATIYVKKT